MNSATFFSNIKSSIFHFIQFSINWRLFRKRIGTNRTESISRFIICVNLSTPFPRSKIQWLYVITAFSMCHRIGATYPTGIIFSTVIWGVLFHCYILFAITNPFCFCQSAWRLYSHFYVMYIQESSPSGL